MANKHSNCYNRVAAFVAGCQPLAHAASGTRTTPNTSRSGVIEMPRFQFSNGLRKRYKKHCRKTQRQISVNMNPESDGGGRIAILPLDLAVWPVVAGFRRTWSAI